MLNKVIVNLQRMDIRLHQHRFEVILSNGKDRGNIRISRYDDLVTLLHHAHLLIGTEDKCQGIESIPTPDAVASADILSIMLFEPLRSISFEIPSTLKHISHSLPHLLLVRSIHPF